MRYKQFKNAGVEVSSLAVGTWAIGGQNYGAVDRNDSIKAIRTMLDCGVNLIDTAPCYGNGSSEKIVGEAIQGLKRDEILISTKFGLITDVYSGGYKKCATYQNTMREVESSLMNLGTDYIDFYFVHWPDVNTPIDETMAALANLKKQGKIRFVADRRAAAAILYGKPYICGSDEMGSCQGDRLNDLRFSRLWHLIRCHSHTAGFCSE